MKNAPASWTFDWLTQKVGLFNKPETGWVLRGRPHGTPDTGWIVAHDVFHHRPQDTGTYTDEVLTFGAETWFDELTSGTEVLQRELTDSWFGVCALTLENGSRGAEGLLLKTPVVSRALEHPQAELWRTCYLAAVAEAKEAFGEFGEPETWEALASKDHCDRAVCLVWAGYEDAAARWGDRAQARQWFEELVTLADTAMPGSQLDVTWDGEQLTMTRQDPPQLRAGWQKGAKTP